MNTFIPNIKWFVYNQYINRSVEGWHLGNLLPSQRYYLVAGLWFNQLLTAVMCNKSTSNKLWSAPHYISNTSRVLHYTFHIHFTSPFPTRWLAQQLLTLQRWIKLSERYVFLTLQRWIKLSREICIFNITEVNQAFSDISIR